MGVLGRRIRLVLVAERAIARRASGLSKERDDRMVCVTKTQTRTGENLLDPVELGIVKVEDSKERTATNA